MIQLTQFANQLIAAVSKTPSRCLGMDFTQHSNTPELQHSGYKLSAKPFTCDPRAAAGSTTGTEDQDFNFGLKILANYRISIMDWEKVG